VLATPPLPTADRLVKIADAARRLSCSPSKVRQLAAAGELDLVPLGPRSHRVTEASLDALIERRRRSPGE
jgi:excisionase family DNA binding protein